MNTNVSLLLLAAASVLSACATESATPPTQITAPDTNVYFYPAQGRSVLPDQQRLDKYECDGWAARQAGFDPSDPRVPPYQRMQIVAGGPSPSALAGAAISGSAEAEREDELSDRQAQAYPRDTEADTETLNRKTAEFRRALGACLEARGYSVKSWRSLP